MTTRTIGIRHRVKQTAEGEKRPTMVAIKERDDKVRVFELKTETDELDFVRHSHPVEWRPVQGDEPITDFRERHCKWRKVGEKEDVTQLVPHHVRERGEGKKKWHEVVTKVPSKYEGLKPGDRVGMSMGGSGDRLAAALSRQGEKLNANVYRVPPSTLKDKRGDGSKDEDPTLLVDLLQHDRDVVTVPTQRIFHRVGLRDRRVIIVQEAFRGRMDAQRARIATQQRLRQRAIGFVFLDEQGLYPEGLIEDAADAKVASSELLKLMIESEDDEFADLEAAVEQLDVYKEVFAPVTGCGPRISAAIISAVGLIGRFEVQLSPDDEQRIADSYQRSRKLEDDAHVNADMDKVSAQVKPNMNAYQVLSLVRNWKRQHGKGGEAVLIDQALQCHRERGRIRRRMSERGMSRFKAFCGCHVLRGGKYANVPPERQFPRRRRAKAGEAGTGTANWSGVARQALWLFVSDQCNKRPNSEWGQMLRTCKANLRKVHPVPVEVEKPGGKKVTRYSDMHIHKMAIWRCVTRFCERIYKQWIKLERRLQQEGAPAAAA